LPPCGVCGPIVIATGHSSNNRRADTK